MKLERSAAPSLHYEIDDFTDPWKDAPHVILQHGHGRSGRFWYGWVPYLSRFYKVVRPDLRGLGQSSADFDIATQSRLDAYIEDLVAIIGALGAKSVHFCGESMGGQLGLALAALHPRLVRTLTIVATPVLMTKKMEDVILQQRFRVKRKYLNELLKSPDKFASAVYLYCLRLFVSAYRKSL